MSEANSVRQMFSNIADRYDCANHWLSGGIDYYWRSKLVSLVKLQKPKWVVDLATGSGDVAFALKKALAKDTRVTGLDFCHPMLAQAEIKKKSRSYAKDIIFDFGDCMDLPLEDGSIDVLTIAFGFRNLHDRQRGLQEMYRVLKPGGKLFILEFTQPLLIFRKLYYFYLKKVLPKLARILTSSREAYDYLATSIEQFPDEKTLALEISKIGFKQVDTLTMTASIVAIHSAEV